MSGRQVGGGIAFLGLRADGKSSHDALLIARFQGMTNPPRLPMRAGQPAHLRELGYDEIWLQNWLAADPARLGLGQVRVVAQELTAPRGGSLDILAADGDTYYSIEVQLGEVDASHSFRVFDYWARNRLRFEGKTHVAVLVVESAAGRYRPALEALAAAAAPTRSSSTTRTPVACCLESDTAARVWGRAGP